MSELITDEIVDALGRRRYEGMVRADKYPENWPAWQDFHGVLKERVTEGVRADLETVAPLIAARVLEGAADDIALAPALPGESAVSISNAETAAEVWLRKRAKEGRG